MHYDGNSSAGRLYACCWKYGSLGDVCFMAAIHEIVGNIMSVCVLAAVLNLLVQDEGTAFGFHMACSLGISLTVVRGALNIFN